MVDPQEAKSIPPRRLARRAHQKNMFNRNEARNRPLLAESSLQAGAAKPHETEERQREEADSESEDDVVSDCGSDLDVFRLVPELVAVGIAFTVVIFPVTESKYNGSSDLLVVSHRPATALPMSSED